MIKLVNTTCNVLFGLNLQRSYIVLDPLKTFTVFGAIFSYASIMLPTTSSMLVAENSFLFWPTSHFLEFLWQFWIALRRLTRIILNRHRVISYLGKFVYIIRQTNIYCITVVLVINIIIVSSPKTFYEVFFGFVEML